MRAWAFLLGVLAVFVVQSPNLAGSISFWRCAVAADGEVTGYSDGVLRYSFRANGKEWQGAVYSDSIPLRGPAKIFFCPADPARLNAVEPPADTLRRAVSLLAMGLLIFPTALSIFLPWALRRNWLITRLIRDRQEQTKR